MTPWYVRLLFHLTRLIQPLRLIENARERRRLERQEAHENLVDLMDTMLGRVEKIVEHQKEASVAQAHSAGKLADALAEWLEMFKAANEHQADLGTATVRPEDEFDAEQQRERERLIKRGLPINKSKAEQLQWLLEHDELEFDAPQGES